MNKISVVIPLFNKEKFIIQCLDSIFTQISKVDEVIIVDDGSSDNSYMLVEQYIAKNSISNIVLTKQNNSGVSVARNLGISLSTHSYIAFLDADDQWEDNYIYEIKKLIKQYPSAIAYSTSHYINNINGKLWKKTVLPKGFSGIIKNFYISSKKLSILNSSKTIIRADIIKSINGFPEGITNGEDLFIWMELARKGNIAHINLPLVTINQFNDESRFGRSVKIPYPISYYGRNDIKLSSDEKNYLLLIAIKFVVINKYTNDIGSFNKLASYFKNISKLRFILLKSILLTPNILFKTLFRKRG